jgi:hypothetical protein
VFVLQSFVTTERDGYEIGFAMKSRVFDLTLFLAVIIGGVLAWQTGQKRSGLQREHERLARLVGDLPISDPSKLHLQALESDVPLYFKWRVYLPPNYRLFVWSKSGSLGTSSSSQPSQFIAQMRIRENEEGLLHVYTQFHGGSSRMSLDDNEHELANFLRGKWHKIQVEQVGVNDVVVVEQDQSVVLLKLTLSEDLQIEARKKLTSRTQTRYVPVLFEWVLGPKSYKK